MSDNVSSTNNSANSATNTNTSGNSNANAQNNLNSNANVDNQNINNSQNVNDAQNAKDNNNDALGDLFSHENKDNNQQQQNVVPESYKFTDADGNDYGFDEETQQSFTNAFKDLGLSQEQATKALNLYVQDMKEMLTEMDAENAQKHKEQIQTWKKEIANDPQLGGVNLQQTKQNIANVMNKFGNDDLKAFLNSGAGYNPTVIRFLNDVGAQLGNDSAFINGKGAGNTQSESSYERAKRMYPNSPALWR